MVRTTGVVHPKHHYVNGGLGDSVHVTMLEFHRERILPNANTILYRSYQYLSAHVLNQLL